MSKNQITLMWPTYKGENNRIIVSANALIKNSN